jgi:hypothetical protein
MPSPPRCCCNFCRLERLTDACALTGDLVITQAGGRGTQWFSVPPGIDFQSLAEGERDVEDRTGKMKYYRFDFATTPTVCTG